MSECPCRACRAASAGIHWGALFRHDAEAQIRSACTRFIEDRPRWSERPWLYTLAWLEAELDDALGVTHARYATQHMRDVA